MARGRGRGLDASARRRRRRERLGRTDLGPGDAPHLHLAQLDHAAGRFDLLAGRADGDVGLHDPVPAAAGLVRGAGGGRAAVGPAAVGGGGARQPLASIAFLEEMWSRNLGHLFVSPIRSWEMATGIIIAALLRTLLGLVPVSLMAWAFFGYNDLFARPAAGRLLRHPADVLLVDRACHVGHDHARRPERRELRLGRRLHPDEP